MLRIYIFLLFSITLIGCDLTEDKEYKGYAPGILGEHPIIHKLQYQSSFVVLKADYFKSIEAFHTFAQIHEFYPTFNRCFNSLFDVTFKSENFPCITTYTEKGAPTKIHMTYTVTKKDFNNYDGINFVEYTIKVSTLGNKYQETIIAFQSTVEPVLNQLTENYKNAL